MADEITEKIIIEVEQKGVQETDKAMDSLTESIDENKKATEENKEEQEEYNKSLGDSIKDVKIFGVSMNSLSASFKATTGAVRASTGGLKLFKVALASTGIGLLVIALGSLFTFLTRSQEGADILSKSLRVIGNVINVLLDRLSDFGGGLLKLFTGDIKGGFSDMKNSFIGIGDAISENIDRAKELADALVEIRETELVNIFVQAELNKRIARNRELMNDTTEAIGDRIEAGKNALLINEAMALSNINLFTMERDQFRESLKEGATTAEERKKLAELNARIINEETKLFTSNIRVRNRLQGVQKEQEVIWAKEREERAEIASNLEIAHLKTASVLRQHVRSSERIEIEDLANYELDQAKILADGLLNLQKKQIVDANNTANTRVRINDLMNQAIGDGAQALFGGIAALAGQNSVLGKASAIAEATINTWKGVASIIGDGTLPNTAKPFFIAAAIAQGLAAVKQITSVPLPKVQTVDSVFGDGGHIRGASHQSPSRGVRILAEGGEFVMNKRSMNLPGVSSLMESINSLGATSRSHPVGSFANGGAIPSNLDIINLERAVLQQQTVLILEDLQGVENNVRVTNELASL